jgi:RNA-binding protein YlmH
MFKKIHTNFFVVVNENLLSTIRKNIERIRNVLVHLREQRENRVILPTPNNDNKLTPYLFIIKRIAEKMATQFE